MSASYATTEGRAAFVRMDFNEGPTPPPELTALDPDVLFLYPEYEPLKAAAARAWGVDASNLVPVNGADEGIFLLLRLLGGEGMVLPVPAFPMYRLYADQLGVKVAEVPLDASFDLDLEATLAAPGGLFALTSPNNPTGRAIPEAALRRILAQGRTVLLDETYAPFCAQDFVRLQAEYPNLLILRTLSKAYGVPGLRCGFILAPAALARELDGLRSPFNVNAAAATLGRRLLAEDTGFKERVAGAARASRALRERLEAAGYRAVPSDTHFFMVELGAEAPAKLRQAGILIKDLSRVGPGFCRISVASEGDARRFEQAFLGGRA
jgi:histidinol-phosphate aminotransferase